MHTCSSNNYLERWGDFEKEAILWKRQNRKIGAWVPDRTKEPLHQPWTADLLTSAMWKWNKVLSCLNYCHALKKIIIVITLAEANPNEFWHLKQISGGERYQESLYREETLKMSKILSDRENQKRRYSRYNNSSLERCQAWKSMACSENSKMSVMCISWILFGT